MRVTSAAKAFMARWRVRTLAACLLSLATLSATAQTVTRPFSALRPTGDAAAAAHALVVELSPREALSGVHLRLAAAAALPAGARYVVWVNGAQVAEADANAAEQILALSPNAFVPGTNSIQLALMPRSAAISAETALANLAPIDDARSSVSLDFAGLRPDTAPTLAQLPVAFDRRAWMPRTVTVELGGDSTSPEQLRAAALAVQGVAARMRQVDVTAAYQGESATGAPDRDPASWMIAPEAALAGDVLLVGTRKALADLLPAPVARAITGPFLGLYAANEGKSVIVVLSGITDADCVHAAQAFADTAMVFPARSAIALDEATAIHAPPTRRAVSLGQKDPALVRAALNFAAIQVRATGVPADFTFTFSSDSANADLFFGRDAALSAHLRRQLPVYPALQPGQAVSLPGSVGVQRFIAVLGNGTASVAGAIDMLRQPATWSLFTKGPTLFDTTAQSAVPLTLGKRSPVATLRLQLDDLRVFWSVLVALLVLLPFFLNVALKAQVAKRLDAGDHSPSSATPPKQ
ncbi:hypothetical protein [Paraburkholderia sp. SIMBA_030]|uniref:hypothetical protein n=1 Tax=Paraburkholderia sp. SIMBA_030 TaxID=3085773 RepID=UPI00397E908B